MATATDPVCGKQFESSQAVAVAEHGLKSHYFCSTDCRDQFQVNPEAYIESPSPPTCANCGGSISQDDLVCPHCSIPLIAG